MSRSRLAAFAVVAALLLASCSSDGSDSSSTTAAAGGAATTTTAPEVERPDGPAAEVVREIDGDGSAFLGASRSTDLETAGYEEHEFVVSGSAVSYEPEGELSGDGMWTLAPSTDTADYTTRIVVRRPAEAADANGTVVATSTGLYQLRAFGK